MYIRVCGTFSVSYGELYSLVFDKNIQALLAIEIANTACVSIKRRDLSETYGACYIYLVYIHSTLGTF